MKRIIKKLVLAVIGLNMVFTCFSEIKGSYVLNESDAEDTEAHHILEYEDRRNQFVTVFLNEDGSETG